MRKKISEMTAEDKAEFFKRTKEEENMYKRKWKYRVRTLSDGTRKYYVLTDGVFTEVPKAVFKLLDSSDAREDYEKKRSIERRDTYLEFIRSKAGPDITAAMSAEESAEDAALRREGLRMRDRVMRMLPDMVRRLPRAERDAVICIYLKGMSLRAYAEKEGISLRQAVRRRNSGLGILGEDICEALERIVDGEDLYLDAL